MKRITVTFGALVAIAAASLFGGGRVHAQSSSGATLPATPPPVAQTAKVLPGDTLDKIARDHGTSYQRLFNANPDIADPNVIYADETIRIPAADEQLADRSLPGAPASTPANIVSTPAITPVPPATPPAVVTADVWDRLAQCESGGNWSIDTGNGYYGGLQFSQGTWNANGGSGSPATASREQQIAIAQTVVAKQGFSAWPACSSQLGL